MYNQAITTDEFVDRKTADELTEKVTGQIMDQLDRPKRCDAKSPMPDGHANDNMAAELAEREKSFFHMVYADGGHSPAVKHYKYSDAEDEAKRIAAKTLKPVYVLTVTEKITAEITYKTDYF